MNKIKIQLKIIYIYIYIKIPNQNDDANPIYFYYNSASYDGIGSIIITEDFPPYITGNTMGIYYFIRKNGILPEHRVQPLTYSQMISNTKIIFDNEECDITPIKIKYSYFNGDTSKEVNYGDILLTLEIQINK